MYGRGRSRVSNTQLSSPGSSSFIDPCVSLNTSAMNNSSSVFTPGVVSYGRGRSRGQLPPGGDNFTISSPAPANNTATSRGRGHLYSQPFSHPIPGPQTTDYVPATVAPAGAESEDDDHFYARLVNKSLKCGDAHSDSGSDVDEVGDIDEDWDFLFSASSKIISGDTESLRDPYVITEERQPPGKFYGSWIKELRDDKQDTLRPVFRQGASFYNDMEVKTNQLFPITHSKEAKDQKVNKYKASTDCRPLIDWIIQYWKSGNVPCIYLVTLYALNRATWSANTPELQNRKNVITKALMTAVWECWQAGMTCPPQFPLPIQRIALSHAMRQTSSELQTQFCGIYINRQLISSPNASNASSATCGEDFVMDVLRLLYHGEYARAIRVARLTGAKDFVPAERILLPMMALRYDACIQELLDGSPSLQLKFIQLLDEYHTVGPKYLERALRNMNLEIPSDDISTVRALRKMAGRYSSLYEISPEESQRIKCRGEENSVRYYLRRWVNATDSQEKVVMQDYLINHIVNREGTMRTHLRDFIISILNAEGLSDAVPQWWEKFQTSLNVIIDVEERNKEAREKLALQEAEESERKESTLKAEFDEAVQSWSDNGIYYVPQMLSHQSIRFVSTSMDFVEALEYLQCMDTLGIDIEAHTDLSTGQSTVSLLQVASNAQAFLFDMLSLPSVCDSGLWMELKQIFDHPNIVKLGYGLASDLNELVYCVSHMQPLVSTPSKEAQSETNDMGDYYPCVDLSIIDKSGELDGHFPPLPRDEENGGLRGLSAMCQRVLGKPLRKSETMSDWSSRPLRLTQRIYAALDAMCLVEIYSALIQRGLSVEANITVDSAPRRSTFKKPRYFV